MIHGEGRAKGHERGTCFCWALTTFVGWLSLSHLFTICDLTLGSYVALGLWFCFFKSTVWFEATCKGKAWTLVSDISGFKHALLHNSCDTLSAALLLWSSVFPSVKWRHLHTLFKGGVHAQWCLTVCNSMDCSLPGSSIHGIFQARILAWADISSSKGSSWPRDWAWVSCIAGRFFTTVPLGKPFVRTEKD